MGIRLCVLTAAALGVIVLAAPAADAASIRVPLIATTPGSAGSLSGTRSSATPTARSRRRVAVRTPLARSRRPLRAGRLLRPGSSPVHHVDHATTCIESPAATPARESPTWPRRCPGTRRCRLPPVCELRPVPPTPASATLPRLRSFVSPLTGVVRCLSETLAAPGGFAWSASGASSRTARRRSERRSSHTRAASMGRAIWPRRRRSARRSSGTRAPTSRTSGSWSHPPESWVAQQWIPSGSRCSRRRSTGTRRFPSARSRARARWAGSRVLRARRAARLSACPARVHALAVAGGGGGSVGHATSSGWPAPQPSRRRSSPGSWSSSSVTPSCSRGTTGCRCRSSTGAPTKRSAVSTAATSRLPGWPIRPST